MIFKVKHFLSIISIAIVIGGAFYLGKISIVSTSVANNLQFDEQEAAVRAIAQTQPAVVSIVVYDDEDIVNLNIATGQTKIESQRVLKGRGTGFLISSDGYIISNKHVVESAGKNGSYRIILNSGKQYYAQLIGKDPLNDLAVLRIFEKDLPFAKLGDSNSLQIGTTVIAIGNALGLYQNTATKGIVSGLGRSITASDKYNSNIEILDNIIQTDAEINPGNSGGPLLNLQGQVIGINVAIDETGSAIGFAIPINDARPVIKSIIKSGRIIRPKLGLHYIMLTSEMAIDNKLNRTSGAWINSGGTTDMPIEKNGPADIAGLQAGDIIFEINAIKVEGKDTLLSIIQRYQPGDKIGMKVMRGARILIITAILGEF